MSMEDSLRYASSIAYLAGAYERWRQAARDKNPYTKDEIVAEMELLVERSSGDFWIDSEGLHFQVGGNHEFFELKDVVDLGTEEVSTNEEQFDENLEILDDDDYSERWEDA